MSLKLPSSGKELCSWSLELIEECRQSAEQRRDLIKMYRSYYFTGTSEGQVATYNRCYPHIERLGAFLYSPTDVRFDIEFDESEDEETHAMGHASARHLNRTFHNRSLDLSFATAVNGALIDGCNILKGVWGHDGPEGWVIRPQFFGVLREDIDDLDRQEAFVHSTYMTPSAFERTVVDHPDRKKLVEMVKDTMQNAKDRDEFEDDYFHQIVVGGTQPVSTTTSSGSGMVGIVGVPTPVLDARVATSLIRLDELWVQDRERQDYTTIRRVGNVIVEGKEQRRNLSGLSDTLGKNSDSKGFHPFVKVCPNEAQGYFWGMSEIACIHRLQDSLNDQIRTLTRLGKLKGDPPKKYIGFTGINQEKHKAFKRPGGFISEENPNAKAENVEIDIPEVMFQLLEKTEKMFDEVAGFTAQLKGEGAEGVRSQAQSESMTRNASPRMKDRALLVERQCSEWGEFNFRLLQAKDAEVMQADKKTSFLLSQLPDDAKVTVDSHTSSPVYQDDSLKLALILQKAGAIDAADLIMLTHPPHEDILIARAKARDAAKAKMLQEHPELLGKGGKKAKA